MIHEQKVLDRHVVNYIEDNKIQGYISYSPHDEETLRIHNLKVNDGRRRASLGSQLCDYLVDKGYTKFITKKLSDDGRAFLTDYADTKGVDIFVEDDKASVKKTTTKNKKKAVEKD